MLQEGERPLSGEIGNPQVWKVSKCIPLAEETMQTWRANSSQVNSWTYPLLGVCPRTTGRNKPLELRHAVVIARGLVIPTTYFQQTHEQSPECYNDIIAQSPGICTLISDGSSKKLIKPQLQGPSLSCALWCWSCGRCRGFWIIRASGICCESFPPST